MIEQEKLTNALRALQVTLIKAMKMAYDKEAHQRIADLLDAAEHVPDLIISEPDTVELRAYLEHVAQRCDFQLILDRFDGS